MMKLKGVMPPIATPFEDGDVASDRLKENLRRWNQTDLSGYLVLGSNGEAVSLNESEKLSVVEASRAVIPSSKIMLVGTGLESTQETVRFTNQVAQLGADYALVITPSFFKGSMKPEILYDYFMAVAESAEIGILIYNVPKFTGINMEPELVARLSEHPNIIGIKDSSGNIGQLSEIVHLCEKGFAVFTGSAPVFFPALCIGAVGGILAATNIVPQEFCQIQDLYAAGKLDEARELQNLLTPLAKAVTAKYSIGGLKVAMDVVGYFGGHPRPPLKRPVQEAEEELKQLILHVRDRAGS
ncbi:MAG: dihydrodipicolinate synthase family protein [Deltaproteobacteria bacterium]|nr:dihydrodipicolinate synthase family protein [Deltaproteobacteria bacterium]MBW2340399.1 dihydrodipicolinate synthase family protein [Deltaproteobacteria bacterium]